MEPNYPRVVPVGEAAFTVEFGDTVAADLNRNVHALDVHVQGAGIEGLVETVPTYRSLLVCFDPRQTDVADLERRLLSAAAAVVSDEVGSIGLPPRQLFEVPVHYGGEDGPDLEKVAAHCDLSTEEVIRRHSAATYQVAMLGFAPGFAYLLGLPASLATPRLATPRLRVPPGSVGLAGNQTGVYALSTPGGWRIIGRTALHLFNPRREDPFLIKAGDLVRFVPD